MNFWSERGIVAWHEAGHAIAAFHYGVPIDYLTCEPDAVAEGRVMVNFDRNPPSDFTLSRMAVILMAGDEAVFGMAGHRLDMESDLEMVRSIWSLALKLDGNGVSDSGCALRHFRRCARRGARRVLAKHWEKLSVLAEALLAEGCLAGDTAHDIFKSTEWDCDPRWLLPAKSIEKVSREL